MRLAMDDVVWDVDLRLLHDRVQRGLTELVMHAAFVGLADAARDVFPQLVERVEDARLEGELVVELRHPLLAHFLHRRLEARLFARQFFGAVVVWELDLQRPVLPRLRADQLVLEAWDQTARAQLDRLTAALATLERLIVDIARVVEYDEVAVLCLALDRLER